MPSSNVISYGYLKALTVGLCLGALSFILNGCDEGSSRSFKDNTRILPKNELVGVSPAFDPSVLTDKEKEIFGSLSPIGQKTFALLSEKQRAFFLTLLQPYLPDDAVWKAAESDVLQMPKKEQSFYFKLSPSNKLLFLALDDGPTLEAVRLSKEFSSDTAIKKATIKEIESYPEKFQKFTQKLSPDEQALFFTLTYNTQQFVIKNYKETSIKEILNEGMQKDIERLALDQQKFIKQLNYQSQILFLILSPEKRGMSIYLTKKLDVNLSIEYAYFIEP